jgi:hypothetical protein
MKDHEVRFVVRPLGISVIKEDTSFKSLVNLANQACLRFAQEDELLLSNIRQLFPVSSSDKRSSNTQLLATILGAIKYLHLPSLGYFDTSLVESSQTSI